MIFNDHITIHISLLGSTTAEACKTTIFYYKCKWKEYVYKYYQILNRNNR